ncbi:MAG: methylated-DNA--[protein]-cysteine S-methyltransferase [Armatimonadota bacterium]
MDAQTGSQETPWGPLVVEISERGVRRVRFTGPPCPPLQGPCADALNAYLHGRPIPADLPVDLDGLPPFARRVLDACRQIPYGQTMTYAQLAAAIGQPRAARAVGGALARNPVPVIIPCHRVLGAGGQLTGFLGGLEWKRALLEHEGVDMEKKS